MEGLNKFNMISTDFLQLLAFKWKKADSSQTAFEESSKLESFFDATKSIIENMDLKIHSLKLDKVRQGMEKRIVTEELSRVYTELTRGGHDDLIKIFKNNPKVDLQTLPVAPDVQEKLKKIPITKKLIPRAAEKVNKGEADLNRIFDFFTFTKDDLQEYLNLIK